MRSIAAVTAALLVLGIGAASAVRAEAPAPAADPSAPDDGAGDPDEEPAAPAADFEGSIYGPCNDPTASMPDYCFAADATPGPVPPYDPFALWRGRSGGARFDGQSIFAAAGLKPQDLRPAERDPRPERFSEVAQVRLHGDLGESGKAWAFEGRSCGDCISLYLIYEASTAWHVEVVTIDPAIVGPGEEQLCTWPNRYYNFTWQCWVRPRTVLAREPDQGAWQRLHQAIFDIVMDAEPHPWTPSR
jgi:hypothetical protein